MKALDRKTQGEIINKEVLVEQVRCQNKKCNALLFEHEIYYGTVIIKCYRCNTLQKHTFNALDI